MLKRPSASETEDDLLKFQKQFLESKAAPSVQVIRKTEKRKPDDASATGQEPTGKDVVSMEGINHHCYNYLYAVFIA